MDKIAAGPVLDRRDLFRESASRLGMNPAIVILPIVFFMIFLLVYMVFHSAAVVLIVPA